MHGTRIGNNERGRITLSSPHENASSYTAKTETSIVGLSIFSNSSCTYFASHLYIALHCKKCLMDSFPFHASCHHRNNGNAQCYEIYLLVLL